MEGEARFGRGAGGGTEDEDGPVVVEVRNRFDGSWSQGFEIAERVTDSGEPRFKIRRLSDGRVLPTLFRADDIIRRAQ